MNLRYWTTRLAMGVADLIFAHRPQQPRPPLERLKNCKIIAHRGAHDQQVKENTLAAFERAVAAGVWGLEMDLRWSADLHPVVHHDADLARLFGARLPLSSLTLSELRERFPEIPTLAEVIARYGGRVHLMLEIKSEPYPRAARQKAILKDHLASLTPRDDYHLLALNPDLFERAVFAPPQTFLPVGELNLKEMSRLALGAGYGGVLGHYVMMTDQRLQHHRKRGQPVGTAYIGSLNLLYREINRGVEWVFSNNAVQLQRMVFAAVASSADPV